MADYVGPTAEQLQDLLLENSGFADFLLGLTTISASLLGARDPMLCAITVERDTSPATVASSSDKARRLDEKQYALDDGPCLTALRNQRTVLIEDLRMDRGWRDYAERVAGEGVRSVLAVPIESEGASRAALNCYALTPGVFDKPTVAAVEAHAVSISKTLRLALRLHAGPEVPEDVKSALQSRAVVDAAVSLIMVQNLCSREQAMDLLRTAAVNNNRRIREIATEILRGSTSAGLPSPMQPSALDDDES
ncbi:GAF and ANTAR domain-containing protein [Paenarthrobacter nicotinovorans]|uniref:GAF and ANTAR domain-containing protein n=1 Tax=Paenarthrobacter nicotinovorans TaxID=29320 RepID=UPI0037F3AA7C